MEFKPILDMEVAMADRINRPIALKIPNLFMLSAYCTAAGGAFLGLVLLEINTVLTFFVAAILCGYSEVDGLCGSAHVGTITPLRQFGDNNKLWLQAVLGYTIGGLLTASIVGLLLGAIGSLFFATNAPTLFGLAALAAILAIRELGLINFSMPQIHRQTHQVWAWDYGIAQGATMWGAHIGLGFATVITHGGFYVIVLVAAIHGPVIGAAVYALYWLGRTLPIWLAPLLARRAGQSELLMQQLLEPAAAYRHLAMTGLVCVALAAHEIALRS